MSMSASIQRARARALSVVFRRDCRKGLPAVHKPARFRAAPGKTRPFDANPAHLKMSPTSSQAKKLAARLMTYESREGKSSGVESPGAFPVCEKLRAPLSALVGSTGFGALISRSLALASREVPWLRAVRVRADGSLKGMVELESQVGPEKVAEGRVALIAQLIGLLAGLIGQNLTMRLIHDAWPALSPDEPVFMNGETDESE